MTACQEKACAVPQWTQQPGVNNLDDYYLHQEGFVLRPVCLLVFWFVRRITQEVLNGLHKTWMEDGSHSRIDPVNFWSGSR